MENISFVLGYTGLMEGIHRWLPDLQIDRIELIEVPGIGAEAAREIVAGIEPKAAA
jgi:hypothetical protein